MDSLTPKTRGELWLARWITRFYKLKPRKLEESPIQQFTRYDIGGSTAANTGSIPRIIWAYWNAAQLPALVQRCVDSWAFFNPGFSIRVLNQAQLGEYIPELPALFHELPVPKQSDWIRLELLRLHGGIWLDASTILTQSLNWVLEEQQRTQAEFVGYFLGKFTTQADCPVVENWFMAAPPASAFITDLHKEFSEQVITRTNSDYISYLQDRKVYEKVLQNIDDPHYLSQHLAIQHVLHSGKSYRLCLARAEDGPFFLHVHGDWRRTPFKLRLLFSRLQGSPVPLIKFRGPDRKRINLYLERKLYVKDSIAQRYLVDLRAPK